MLQDEETDLVARYFGVQAAPAAVRTSDDALADLETHLRNAKISEHNGASNRYLTLQAQAAVDGARLLRTRAYRALDLAQRSLDNLLSAGNSIVPTTPRFVITSQAGLAPLESFLATGRAEASLVTRAENGEQQAALGERLARAQFFPQIFGVAQYSFNPRNAPVTQPDYLVGVVAQWTLVSPVDRGQLVAAARTASRAATELEASAQTDSDNAVRRAYDDVLNARDAYVASSSSVAAAREGVRAAEERFGNGRGRPVDVADAVHALVDAEQSRVGDAYAYDVALAALLRQSGRTSDFSSYIARADVIVR